MNPAGGLKTAAVWAALLGALLLAPAWGGEGANPGVEGAGALIARADALFAEIHVHPEGLKNAGALYEQVLAQDPEHAEAGWKLAEIFYIEGMLAGSPDQEKAWYEKSLAQAQAVLKAHPDCTPALFYSGCCHSSLAEMAGPLHGLSLLKKGKAELARIVEAGPESRFAPLAASVLSQVNTETPWPIRDLDEAERLAKLAVEWDPGLTMASVQLARVLLAQKQPGEAAREARRCLAVTSPTYMSDAVLWDWPGARDVLQQTKE